MTHCLTALTFTICWMEMFCKYQSRSMGVIFFIWRNSMTQFFFLANAILLNWSPANYYKVKKTLEYWWEVSTSTIMSPSSAAEIVGWLKLYVLLSEQSICKFRTQSHSLVKKMHSQWSDVCWEIVSYRWNLALSKSSLVLPILIV